MEDADALGPEATVEGLLEALASDRPTPGGGGAAALALALGAALVAMTARLTVGRRRYRDVEDAMRRITSRADEIRAEALGLIRADADAYRAVSQAVGLARETAEQKEIRSERLSVAAESASRVPLRVGDLSAEVIALATEAVAKGNRNVISDAGAAAALARSAIRISEMNVAANLPLVRDADTRRDFGGRMDELRERLATADAAVDGVLDGAQR